jgi:hypothetical protein
MKVFERKRAPRGPLFVLKAEQQSGLRVTFRIPNPSKPSRKPKFMKLNRFVLPSVIALFSSFMAVAQPQLTADDLPALGDKKTDYVADSVGVEAGPAGANMSWDFSTLARIGSNDSVISEVVAASSTLYASDFPSATLAAKSVSGNSWAYYSTSATQASMLGVVASSGSTTVKQKYNDPQLILQVPFTYNQSMSDDFEASYDANGITVYRSGTSTATADAYGTVIMPHRTFSNVLRVKNVSFIKDSFDLFGDWVSTTTEVTSYSFISPGRVAPILTIMYTTTTTQGIPGSGTKTVTFNDLEPLASVKPLSMLNADVKLYPNPASSTSNLVVNAKENSTVNVSICNALGEKVACQYARLHAGQNSVSLPVENLKSGIYFVNISDGTGSLTRRLIIE